MPYSNSKETHGTGDHYSRNKHENQMHRSFRSDRDQVLDLFGPATKARFSPSKMSLDDQQNDYSDSGLSSVVQQTRKKVQSDLVKIKKKNNSTRSSTQKLKSQSDSESSSTSSSSSADTSPRKTAESSHGKTHNKSNRVHKDTKSISAQSKTGMAKWTYPYHGNFVVDMENQPDYYGKYGKGESMPNNKYELDKQHSSNAERNRHSKAYDKQNLDLTSIVNKKSEGPIHPNIPKERATQSSGKYPKWSSTLFDKRGLVGNAGYLQTKNWKKVIFGAIIILVIISLLCVILGLVLRQISGDEDMISTMENVKVILKKCCFKDEHNNSSVVKKD